MERLTVKDESGAYHLRKAKRLCNDYASKKVLINELGKYEDEREQGCEYCTGELETACNDCNESCDGCYAECKRLDKRLKQDVARGKEYRFCCMCGKELT